ncbi:RNA recognition motif domain-containing protein [Methylobacter sp. YRD-M1]|uniref:RNA recognition motif domain-containing protein n=1 Tax=Methylobacter sp. YRD-M1 TaxID=2911520 RepID=UPI00227D29BA|nr:RNA-binding protein [Methylobacter sp. YRD-M1]WAK02263.1 RNA-binding protein [Methylobacter sp. YRD-M1]
MLIILKNIPANTQKKEIEEFIWPAVKGGFFRKGGKIESIQIKGQIDTQLNMAEFHALVRIEPDAVAIRVIKKLNRKLFKGKYTAIDEFHHRDWHNDRRTDAQQTPNDRRHVDRRRYHLKVIENISQLFSGRKSFHRKLD